MPVEHSEIKIVKTLDKATPKLFSQDAFVFNGTAVDPTNPNVDLRPMGTPGPDDDLGLPAVQHVGLPAVQTDDGLLLPAVQTDGGLLLPAVQTDDGLLLPY